MRSCLRGDLDVVHFHWTSAFLVSQSRAMSVIKSSHFVLACQILKCSGVKLIWTVHNLFEHERRDPAWERRAHQILCRFYDRIIVHCPRAVGIVHQAYDLPTSHLGRFVVVPHGHFIDQYPNQVTRAEARRRFGLNTSDFVFLYFGQIRPHKNLPLLIDVFKRLDHPHAHLIIAGEPPNDALERQILTLAAEHRRIYPYLGRVPDEDIQYFMNASDVVVLPFQDILTSSTMILSMCFGKSVITPISGCSPDILVEQPELLYGPYNPDGLFSRMQDCMSSDLHAIGRINLESVRWSSWDMVARVTASIYKDCLSGHPTS